MAKLSAEKIELIQKLYAQYGVYSRVAKEVGCAASTVKKYVDGIVKTKGAPSVKVEKFKGEPLPIEQIYNPLTREGWLRWCEFTQEDMESVESLWREM